MLVCGISITRREVEVVTRIRNVSVPDGRARCQRRRPWGRIENDLQQKLSCMSVRDGHAVTLCPLLCYVIRETWLPSSASVPDGHAVALCLPLCYKRNLAAFLCVRPGRIVHPFGPSRTKKPGCFPLRPSRTDSLPLWPCLLYKKPRCFPPHPSGMDKSMENNVIILHI